MLMASVVVFFVGKPLFHMWTEDASLERAAFCSDEDVGCREPIMTEVLCPVSLTDACRSLTNAVLEHPSLVFVDPSDGRFPELSIVIRHPLGSDRSISISYLALNTAKHPEIILYRGGVRSIAGENISGNEMKFSKGMLDMAVSQIHNERGER
jgi:hypothetical protein